MRCRGEAMVCHGSYHAHATLNSNSSVEPCFRLVPTIYIYIYIATYVSSLFLGYIIDGTCVFFMCFSSGFSACVSRASPHGKLGAACCPVADRTRVYSEHTAYRWRPAVTLLILFVWATYMRSMAVYITCDGGRQFHDRGAEKHRQ